MLGWLKRCRGCIWEIYHTITFGYVIVIMIKVSYGMT